LYVNSARSQSRSTILTTLIVFIQGKAEKFPGTTGSIGTSVETSAVVNVDSEGMSQVLSPEQKVSLTSTTQITTALPDYLLEQAGCMLSGPKGKAIGISSARLVESPGVVPGWSLDVSIQLSDVEGEAILGAMVSDKMEEMSPQWECGSFGEEVV
jgi:hypothetical protein